MGIARNIARLVPNGSGLLPNANIEAVAASKLTGQVPDANAPSGSVIQVVQATSTTTSTYSNASTWNDMSSFLSASITPTSSSNKILIMLNLGKVHNINGVNIRLSRNASALFYGDGASLRPLTQTASVSGFNGDGNHSDGVFCSYLDSPSTTSSVNYSFQAYSEGSATTSFNRSISDSDSGTQYHSRAASSLILMEISA